MLNNWKRILSVGMVAVMLCSILSVQAGAAKDATIKVSSSTVQPGETAAITIALENNPGIVSMTLEVEYDSSVMSLVDVKDAGVFGATVHNPDKTKNPYILSWANDTASENYTINGTIVTLSFQVKDTAAVGSYPVTVKYDNVNNEHIYNADLSTVDFAVIGGSVTVEATGADDPDSGTLTKDVFWKYNRDSKLLDITGDISQGKSVLVASYDKNGKMLELDQLVDENIGLDLSEGAFRIKLFMLDESMKPLCDAVEILVQ